MDKEITLLTSDDRTITLTTHRLLQRNAKENKEIMLADYVSHQVLKRRSSYYKILTIIFLIAAVGLTIWAYAKQDELARQNFRQTNSTEQVNPLEKDDYPVSMIKNFAALSGSIFIVSFILFLISNRNFVLVRGKYSVIDFTIKKISKESLDKFLNTMVRESNSRKKEKII